MSEETILTFSNLQDEKLLAKFADVVTIWAFGEAVVEDIIAGLLGTDVIVAYALTTNINISTRLKASLAIAHMRFETTLFEEFETLISEMQIFVPFRNKLVHGLWSESPYPGIALVATIKSSSRVKNQTEYINLEYLIWLSQELNRIILNLFNFGREHGLIEQVPA